MFVANHAKLNIEDLTRKIVISDAAGLEVLNPSFLLENSRVEIRCDQLESRDINKQKATAKIMATGIIVLINPAKKDKHTKYQIIKFITDAFPIEMNGKFSANVKYHGGDVTKFQPYQIKKAFGVFVTLDEELNPLDISETIESGVWGESPLHT